jgi:carboxypeptidase-like protein
MSKSVNIKVPQPCHENWNNMTPKEQGWFCGSCQTVVVDFTAMSDKEMLDYISKAAGQHACGRFSNDQLNRNIETPRKQRLFTWAYIWNFLLATFLVTDSYAQKQPVVNKKPNVQLPNLSPTVGTFAVDEREHVPSKEISGTIIAQDSKQPIAGATIMVQGITRGVVTDSLGRFKIMVDDNTAITLEISSVGYETQTLVMNKKKSWHNIKVIMKGDEAILMGKYGFNIKENKPGA